MYKYLQTFFITKKCNQIIIYVIIKYKFMCNNLQLYKFTSKLSVTLTWSCFNTIPNDAMVYRKYLLYAV